MRPIDPKERRLTPAALLAKQKGELKNFMAAVTPGGIEAQEKAGQMAQAKLETLPIDLGLRFGGDIQAARKVWEAAGFKFGEKADNLFVYAKFPAGWEKRPTNHSMWSDIVDGNGRVRGQIFYKAAFYDQRAHADLCARFTVANDYAKPLASIYVNDACGESPFKITGLEQPDWMGDRAEAERRQGKQDEARQMCLRYLEKNLPDYQNPNAYWP